MRTRVKIHNFFENNKYFLRFFLLFIEINEN